MFFLLKSRLEDLMAMHGKDNLDSLIGHLLKKIDEDKKRWADTIKQRDETIKQRDETIDKMADTVEKLNEDIHNVETRQIFDEYRTLQ